MQQAVLQIGAIDHDMVSKHKAPLERPASDAAIQHLGLIGLSGDAAGDQQGVFLDGQLDIIRPKASNGHGEPIALLAGLFDVVGRIGLVGRRSGVDLPRQPVKADGGAKQRRQIHGVHGLVTFSGSKVQNAPPKRAGTVRPRSPIGHPGQTRYGKRRPLVQEDGVPNLQTCLAESETGYSFLRPMPANLRLNLAT